MLSITAFAFKLRHPRFALQSLPRRRTSCCAGDHHCRTAAPTLPSATLHPCPSQTHPSLPTSNGFVRPTGLVVSAPALAQNGATLNRHDAEGPDKANTAS